jgi:hypothetical protein
LVFQSNVVQNIGGKITTINLPIQIIHGEARLFALSFFKVAYESLKSWPKAKQHRCQPPAIGKAKQAGKNRKGNGALLLPQAMHNLYPIQVCGNARVWRHG